MVDIRQTPQYANYLSRIGWKVERIAGTNYFIKKFPIIGSVIKIQRPEEIRYNDIKILSAKYRAFQIIVEPLLPATCYLLQKNGFKLSNSPYLPTKTLQLDLTKSEEQLLREMEKDARAVLRKSTTYHLQPINSLEEFRNSWKQTVGWKRYVPPLSHLIAFKKSFKNKCLFLCCFDESIYRSGMLGGAIFLIGDRIAYYWQAFTNSEGRKKLVQYKIVWEGIKWAKKKGAKIFDFEGIFDARFPNKSWLGFTHFKKSFGGYEIEHPGCYIKNILPF